MYYNQRMDYKARVDFGAWTEGRYVWRVMRWSMIERDQVGFCETLEEAQAAAENAMQAKDITGTTAMKSGGFGVANRYVQEDLFGKVTP